MSEHEKKTDTGNSWEHADTRVAVISIIVENEEVTHQINELLHEYRRFIIGRMGIPYRQRGISIICIAVDAPQDAISALSGKIGRLPGISTKTAYSNLVFKDSNRV